MIWLPEKFSQNGLNGNARRALMAQAQARLNTASWRVGDDTLGAARFHTPYPHAANHPPLRRVFQQSGRGRAEKRNATARDCIPRVAIFGLADPVGLRCASSTGAQLGKHALGDGAGEVFYKEAGF